jgi:hypothetical protein
MRAFLALVAFEIRERRALLAAAAVASVLPVLAPILGGTGSNTAADIREVAMWVMVGCLVPLFALLLGVTFIGRDLSEGRLGFYFAQPLSGPTIWFGKLAAVAILIWAAQLIMMLPTALLSGEPWRIVVAKGLFFEPLGPWISSLTMWIAPLAVILFAHALGLVWRARSVWVVMDIVAIALLVVAARWVISPFLQIFAAYVVLAVYVFLLISTLIGLVVAGAFQLTAGRVDARRGHRALSAVLWSILAIAVVVAAAWGWWIRSARPGDLDLFNGISVGSGDWIAVTGPSAGRLDYFPGFIVNTADGRWISAHSGSKVHEQVVEFSADMSRAVWTTPYSFEETKLMTVDLNDERLRPEWTGVMFKRYSGDMVVSPSGRRVAHIQAGAVTVFDIESGDLLTAAQPGGDYSPYRIHFADEDKVEVLTGMKIRDTDDSTNFRMRWRQYLLDLTTRSLDRVEDINNPWRWWSGRMDNPIRNALEKREVEGQDRLVLVDPEDPEVVADLGEMPKQWSDVRVVTDGEIVVNRKKEERCFLQVFDSEGDLLKRIDFDMAGWAQIGGEVSPGQLAVGQIIWAAEEGQPAERSTIFVDLSDGTVTNVLDGVSPVLGRWGLLASSGAWRIGSIATRLMEGENGSLHLWDPKTQQLEQIIPVPN